MKQVHIIALIFAIKLQVFSLVSSVSFDFMTDLNDPQVAEKRVQREAKPTSCLQPPVTADKSYTVTLHNQNGILDAKPGEAVPKFSIILSRCNEGYAIDYENDGHNELPSVCTDKSWSPPVLKCKKICGNFSNGLNYTTCYEYLGGPKISCHNRLLERAIVIPRCSNKYYPELKVNYDYATCQENGNWDKPVFNCVPDCGKVANTTITLIAGGNPEKLENSPWYVAIYRSELSSNTPDFICGGTLINSELVISAAHCFYDNTYRINQNITLFRAMVGKITRDYNNTDSARTKAYKFQSMYFYDDRPYKGFVNNYASDIVILRLSDKVTFSEEVFPACLYWEDKEHFIPGENSTGKLSGFGAMSDGSLASVLLSAQLPYINYNECVKKVRPEFTVNLQHDKFCAGPSTGPGARAGDSGGGLLFKDNETGLYHLRGVLSTKESSRDSSISTFTDITQYISWILKTIEVTENSSKCSCNPSGTVKQGFCNPKPGLCQCKAFVTGKDCNICKDGFWNLRADNPDGCIACGCSSAGSYSSKCDKTSGSCQCKPNIIGKQCDECSNNTMVLGSNGCEDGPKWVNYAHGGRCSNAVVGGNRTPMNETLFIARHQMFENLLPGKLVPSLKAAFIPLALREQPYWEYEVLCGGSGKWVAASNGAIPRGAVAGGFGTGWFGTETMFVCRALADDGSVVPGKLHPSRKVCFIPNGGEELPKVQYEVLVQDSMTDCKCNSVGSYTTTCEITSKSCKCKPNVIGKTCDRCAPDSFNFGLQGCKADLKWIKYANGDKCSNAVYGGYQSPSTRESIFIARHQIFANLLPGKLVPSQKLAFIPFNNTEYKFSEYEVLCGAFRRWAPGSHGTIPEGAFAGGIGYGDIGRETLYVCKAGTKDRSLIPGRLQPSKKVCYITQGGKEYPMENYEVLLV